LKQLQNGYAELQKKIETMEKLQIQCDKDLREFDNSNSIYKKSLNDISLPKPKLDQVNHILH
jgi:hypothetical protein